MKPAASIMKKKRMIIATRVWGEYFKRASKCFGLGKLCLQNRMQTRRLRDRQKERERERETEREGERE